MVPEGGTHKRGRIVSAHLSPRDDADLISWVEELRQAGLLARAVRTGLRLLMYVERTPGARAIWARGLIWQALEDGLVGPVAQGHAHAVRPGGEAQLAPAPLPPPAAPATELGAAGRGNRVEQNLDRALDSF